MQNKSKRILGITFGVIALIMLTAGASALITKNVVEPEKPAVHKVASNKDNVRWNNPPKTQAQPVAAQQRCDDGNVVGYGVGALAGGLIGNQLGDGDGKKVATVGGAAVGALAGGQYIPTRGVLCPK